MAIETLTLRLQGDVPLRDFARAVVAFDQLVRELTATIGEADIDWSVLDLEGGSAEATAIGKYVELDPLVRVRDAYLVIGHALEAREPVPYSDRVRRAASAIQSVLNGRVTEAIFETSQSEALVRAGPLAPAARAPIITKGAISGRVQTLSNRGSLRFTLYDLLHDKPVSCYLAAGKEDRMLDAWGKLAVVEGSVRRHPLTGRPLAIREITAVDIRPDPNAEDYRFARGAVPMPANAVKPEDAIRHLRDA